MKIRNGFVSNSSSSSFCVVVSKADYKEAIKDIDEDAKKMLEHWASKGKVGNEDVVYFSNMSDNGGNSSMFSPEWNDGLSKFEDYVVDKWESDYSAVFYALKKKLPEGSYIESSDDM